MNMLLVVLFLTVHLTFTKSETIIQLPSFKNNLDGPVTVSGFSSGGAMATQLHVAHSSIISGMAGFSSTFYRYGPGGHAKYSETCTKNKTLVSTSVNDAKVYESSGKIDPLSNLQNAKIFAWTGTKDNLVPTAVTKKVQGFYSNFVSNSNNIRYVEQEAIHEFPTDNYGPPCPKYTSSFIGNCKFSGGYEALSTILGPSIQRMSGNEKIQELKYFNQAEFTAPAKPNSIGLDDSGYFYVPLKCQQQKCPLHIFLHGCTVGNQAYQPEFVKRISYLNLAEANSIVMLFPRAHKIPQKNPLGCWDVFGANGDNYATKEGVQIVAIRKMIDRMFGNF